MSKRYVIQVMVDEISWENVQHPSGNGDWMTRSKTTALNDAVTLVIKGETRALRIAISQPVYSLTPVPELNVAEAVALAKQIGLDMAAEAKANGVSLAEVMDPSYESDDVFADDDDDDDDEAELEPQSEGLTDKPYYLN